MDKHHDNLIVIDFDHTIFNTTKLVLALQKKFLEEFNINEETFTAHRNKIKEYNTVIDIEHFVSSFPEKDPALLFSAMHDVFKMCNESYLFEDVLPFFERHKDNFDILISTHGDCELQTEKITHTNLPSYVQHIISTKSKAEILTPFIDMYNKVYLIEDKAKNIDDVKQTHQSVIAYFIKRPEDMPYGAVESACECNDHTVKDLSFTIV
jgi:FMN phosphatase YigB (HAD superfamily)